jgi:hypothetical protein
VKRPVWIDLINSPHVLFFRTVLNELSSRGIETVVTARAFAQTRELCKLYGIEAHVIGPEGSLSRRGKVADLLHRSANLVAFARRHRLGAVLTHNSYSQLVAARFLGIPSVTTMEYEHQPANHVAFRAANWVLVPECLRGARLASYGAGAGKLRFYRGLKEEVSLAGFVPQGEYRQRIGVPESKVLAVVRPPADFALYHRAKNSLFPQAVAKLVDYPETAVLLLPRNPRQRDDLRRGPFARFVTDQVYDGPNLLAAADIVVSAGGCMNREAALLGTPAYSVFSGRLGCEDSFLASRGLLTLVRAQSDMPKLHIAKKPESHGTRVTCAALVDFVDQALGVIEVK